MGITCLSMSVRAMLVLGLILYALVSLLQMSAFKGEIPQPQDVYQLMDMRSQGSGYPSKFRLSHLKDESHAYIPKRKDGSAMTTEERLRLLEIKFAAYSNFGVKDPFIGSNVQKSSCKQKSSLVEFGCKEGWEGVNEDNLKRNCPGLYDQPICLDELPEPTIQTSKELPVVTPLPANKTAPCLVYDFGIRKQPQFGAIMARTFGCEVHAFDPSPISKEYFENDEASLKLRELPNYHFHPYGAGAVDGTVSLNEYNWGQVSIMKYPSMRIDCGEDMWDPKKKSVNCSQKRGPIPQGAVDLEVKTIPTIIRELGHEGRQIDVLKIDVEGSEFAVLENLIDMSGGCPDYIQQLTLEWHHYNWDVRYGDGSSPPINTISALLRTCGLNLWHIHDPSGWLSLDRDYYKMGLDHMRYNLASFRREPVADSFSAQ